MNPFHRRLITFGQLIEQLSSVNNTNYSDLFEVEHPGYQAFIKPKAVKPKLHFVKPCPKEQRTQIKQLFGVCFNGKQAA